MTELGPATPPEGLAAQGTGPVDDASGSHLPTRAEPEPATAGAMATVQPTAAGAADQPEPAAAIPASANPPADASEICPYLRSADGTWRSTQPQRDHRCWAQTPPSALSTMTQARLCLTPGYSTCELYAAAVAKRTQELERDHIPPERLAGRFNPQVQPVALALDASPEAAQPPAPGRSIRPIVLIGVILALLVVVGLGYMALGGGGPGPTPSLPLTPQPSAIVAASPTASFVPSAPPSAPPSSVPSATAPSTAPPPSLPPGIARTYVVKVGDTIHSIAHRFHITRGRLIAANDLGTPPTITPGQVLLIPYPAGQAPPSPAPS